MELLIITSPRPHPCVDKPGDVIAICPDCHQWSLAERMKHEWRIVRTGELLPTHATCLLTGPILHPSSHFRGWAIDLDRLPQPARFRGLRTNAMIDVPIETIKAATFQREDSADVPPNPIHVEPLVAVAPLALMLHKPGKLQTTRRALLKAFVGIAALTALVRKAQAGTVTYTIGSSGRTYTTIAAFIAAVPSNLVTDGNSYIGDLYNDSEFTGTGTMVTIGALTTDATHTLTIKAAAGQSFQDNASVRTNALKYNRTNGVGIRKTDNYATMISITGAVDYLTISRLQLSRSNSGSGISLVTFAAACNHFQLTDCICESLGTGSSVYVLPIAGSSTALVANVLVVLRTSAVASQIAFGATGGNILFIGCGAVRPSDKTAASTGFQRDAGVPIMQSCYSFGFTTCASSGWDGTNSKNNATDQASGLPGSSNQHSVTYNSGTPFTNAADATRDFRAIAATSLVANGFKDVTNAPNDISGSIRPASPTIGPWEQAPAAPSTKVSRRVIQ